jgi:hypothetical protein
MSKSFLGVEGVLFLKIYLPYKKSKVKQSLYTPWRRLGGEKI